MVVAIYLRNTMRILGLLAVVLGYGLISYQGWVAFQGDTPPTFYLSIPASVPHLLSHTPLLIQGLLGLPWVILMEVPLPLLLLVGGVLAMHV